MKEESKTDFKLGPAYRALSEIRKLEYHRLKDRVQFLNGAIGEAQSRKLYAAGDLEYSQKSHKRTLLIMLCFFMIFSIWQYFFPRENELLHFAIIGGMILVWLFMSNIEMPRVTMEAQNSNRSVSIAKLEWESLVGTRLQEKYLDVLSYRWSGNWGQLNSWADGGKTTEQQLQDIDNMEELSQHFDADINRWLIQKIEAF